MRTTWIAALAAAVALPAQAQTVGVGTMPQGTVSFSTGSVVARMIDEKLGLEARVQPNTGETVLVPLLNNGELDFGIANVKEAAEAYHGTATFDGQPQENLRIAAVLYPLRVALFVRADSDIESIADLAGKRVTYGFSAMGSINDILDAVLANGNLTPADVTPVMVPNVVVGADQFLNERADAFFFAVGAAKVSEVDASAPLRILPESNDPEALARMQESFPQGYLIEVPPLPNFAGVSEPTYVLGYDNLLLTATHVPAETVETVVAGLAENQEMLAAGFPLFRGFDPEKIVKDGMPLPYHDGTLAWAEGR